MTLGTQWAWKAEVTESTDGIAIRVPAESRSEIDTIVVLKMDRPAKDLH
jgi:hypothetical protein